MSGHEVVSAILRARALAATVVALSVLAVAPQAAPAHAHGQTPPATSGLRAQAAGLEDGLPSIVCTIIKRPFMQAVDGMVRLLSKGRYRSTLAGMLAYQIGFRPWCSGAYGRLQDVLRSASREDASVRPKVGPFVFGVSATFAPSRVLPGYDWATVNWNAFTLSSPLRYYYVQYSLNGRRYQAIPDRSVLVDHDDFVRFAVQIDNRDLVSSPWVYSPTYRP
jgi:hypothetical protein